MGSGIVRLGDISHPLYACLYPRVAWSELINSSIGEVSLGKPEIEKHILQLRRQLMSIQSWKRASIKLALPCVWCLRPWKDEFQALQLIHSQDVCSFVFLTFAWPKICYMQETMEGDGRHRWWFGWLGCESLIFVAPRPSQTIPDNPRPSQTETCAVWELHDLASPDTFRIPSSLDLFIIKTYLLPRFGIALLGYPNHMMRSSPFLA